VDASTLLVVFLLVSAASLASYVFSQWSAVRSGDRGVGWAAVGIGTTLLLAAAAIVVLTVSWLPAFRLPENEPAQTVRVDPFGKGTAEPATGRQRDTEVSRAAALPKEQDHAGRSVVDDRLSTGDDSEIPAALSSLLSPRESSGAKGDTAPHGTNRAFAEADPWAATSCVIAFNPDLSDLSRWTIGNECGAPVGILFAACSACRDSQFTSWEYQAGGMILPGRSQRPVTHEQETQYGNQIRYVACLVATPTAIELIGQNSETRSSSSWVERFATARANDACLSRVQMLSDMGRRSGKSIDVLLGVNAPGRIRPGVASEP
jgi:hypothetical protein